jgi:hypothetical protein
MSNERFQGFHGFQRFLCFALAIACFAGASAQESLTAIRAGRMFDARTGAMLANQIILIRGGRIADVGPNVGAPAVDSGFRTDTDPV